MATWWQPVLAAKCVKCGHVFGHPGAAERPRCPVCQHEGEPAPKDLVQMVGAPLAPSEET